MQSRAATVQQYLAELPEERRAAIEAVRAVILQNLDPDLEEGMQYGMIGYYVRQRVHAAGYRGDSRQPLPYAGLASQKGYMSLYLMSVYCGCEGGKETEHARWFRQAWLATGKRLDMGKACIRFKRLDDVPLDVVGEAIRRVPAELYLAHCEAALRTLSQDAPKRPAKTPARKASPSARRKQAAGGARSAGAGRARKKSSTR